MKLTNEGARDSTKRLELLSCAGTEFRTRSETGQDFGIPSYWQQVNFLKRFARP